MDLYTVTSQEILSNISRHCPEALTTYLQCINRAKPDGQVYFSKADIDVDLSEDFQSFRNNIKKLAREGLLEWHPVDNGIHVILAAHDD